MTQLLPDDIRKRLLQNGRLQESFGREGDCVPDFYPVVKLFAGSSCTWLLTELDPLDEDRAFGLCDLGLGFPELGYVSITEIEDSCRKRRMLVEIDEHFDPQKTIYEYAEDARKQGRIEA